MQNKRKISFLMLVFGTALAMILADSLLLIFFGNTLYDLRIRFGVPALVFIIVYGVILGRNAACFSINYFDNVQGELYVKKLKKIGAVPVKMIGLNVLLHAVFLGGIFSRNEYLGISPAMRNSLFLAALSFGILVGTFIYVVCEGLVSTTLISHNFTQYPLSLRKNRQALKAMIIPIAVCLMAVSFACSVTLLSIRLAGGNLYNMNGSAWLFLLIPIVILFICSIILAHHLKKNNASLYTSIMKQLENLSSEQKDLTQRITLCSVDELGSITGMINTFCDHLSRGITDIRKEAETLSNIGNDLASNMNETASSVNEITATVQSIKGRVLNQSASVSQTNTTMEQLVNNIDKLNDHVENQSGNISQASASIEEMVANIHSVIRTLAGNTASVRSLREASEVGRAGLQEIAGDIKEIARESESLLEINSVMSNIAGQTNLLSMNAAIEAAHAEEAGKGFSVVADEIRKLAESSGEQSRTIGTVLKKIKGSIDKISSSAEIVLAKFEAIDSGVLVVSEQEENIRNAMEEQGQGSDQLLLGVSNINEITSQVKISSREMFEGSQEVIVESNNLEKATHEITSGMNEMAMGAEQINIAVNRVNEISIKNRDAINSLLMEVARYKVA